ncbi:hypothetical protein Plec18170_003628 [Paecilomyces lecythidis]
MSKTDCLKTLHLIKGTTLDLVVHKQDAEKKYGAVLHYDGEKGSEPFFVAPHWHKVVQLYTAGAVNGDITGIRPAVPRRVYHRLGRPNDGDNRE